MPDLLERLKPKLQENFTRYKDTPARAQEMEGTTIGLLIWTFRRSIWDREIMLAKEKHLLAEGFLQQQFFPDSPSPFITYSPKNSPQMSTTDTPPPRLSNLSEAKSFYNGRMTATPKTDFFFRTPAVERRGIGNLYNALQTVISESAAMRKNHPEGKLDGLLEATRQTLHFIARYYNIVVKKIPLDINIDAINASSDVCLQYIQFLAQFLSEAAYDYTLCKFSRTKYAIGDAKYYMNSGIDKLEDQEQADQVRTKLYNILRLLALELYPKLCHINEELAYLDQDIERKKLEKQLSSFSQELQDTPKRNNAKIAALNRQIGALNKQLFDLPNQNQSKRYALEEDRKFLWLTFGSYQHMIMENFTLITSLGDEFKTTLQQLDRILYVSAGEKPYTKEDLAARREHNRQQSLVVDMQLGSEPFPEAENEDPVNLSNSMQSQESEGQSSITPPTRCSSPSLTVTPLP